MSRTALDLSPQEWEKYDPAGAIRAQQARNRESTALRRRKALRVARKAAKHLRSVFGAQRVVLFGSLASKDRFTPWSDIDLAAWGISASNYYQAVAAVTSFSEEFKIDLVDVDNLGLDLLESIEREGIEL
jgi:predicted nucleotidyltransferase